MKRSNPYSIVSAFALLAIFIIAPRAQPSGISYQALVRDGAGAAVRNQTVSLRIRIHRDSASGGIAYAETFSTTTNNFGNINVVIGQGSAVFGLFITVDWSHFMFMEIGVDVNGGASYTDLGTTQLMSVPYALYSGRSASATSANISEIRDADNNTRVSTERNSNENVIRFDLNGTEKMRLKGNGLGFTNTGNSIFIGDSAGLNDDLSNRQNVFVGNQAGMANTTGSINTFIGHHSGTANSTGVSNTFSGAYSGVANTTGNSNTFIGRSAGTQNSTGDANTFVGMDAGFYNQTGKANTFAGTYAGLNNTGSGNSFFGDSSGVSNTTGAWNTFVGLYSGMSNTSASDNTFIGVHAGSGNTTGAANTFSGFNAGNRNTTGRNNAYFGVQSGYSNDDGNNNTAVGFYAGGSNTSGSGNVFLGFEAGYNETGANKLYIANSSTTTPLIYGDFSTPAMTVNGDFGYTGAFTGPSDRRLKENIVNVPNALESVANLNGVYYDWKKATNPGNIRGKGRQIGVIAQDVEKVYPELVSTTSDGYKAVDYPKLTAVLIEAVKELKNENAGLQARMSRMEEAMSLSRLKARDGRGLASAQP